MVLTDWTNGANAAFDWSLIGHSCEMVLTDWTNVANTVIWLAEKTYRCEIVDQSLVFSLEELAKSNCCMYWVWWICLRLITDHNSYFTDISFQHFVMYHVGRLQCRLLNFLHTTDWSRSVIDSPNRCVSIIKNLIISPNPHRSCEINDFIFLLFTLWRNFVSDSLNRWL